MNLPIFMLISQSLFLLVPNTAIVAMAQELRFAVPAKIAEWVVSELLAHGSVRRFSLGILARATVSCGSTIF